MSAIVRFTNRLRCPVCGGANSDPQGKGVRCFGFLSSDREYAHCTRVPCGEQEGGGAWAHRLEGGCRCGARHREAVPPTRPPPLPPRPSKDAAKLWARLAEKDPAGEAYLSGRRLWDSSLVEAGVLRFNVGKTGDAWLDEKARAGYRVAFPVRRPDGSIQSISLRHVGDGNPKTLALLGCPIVSAAICRPEVVELTSGDTEFEGDEIEIVEGGPDFLAETLRVRALMAERVIAWCWILGIVGTPSAISVVEAFARTLWTRTVRLAFDADAAGEEAVQKAAAVAYRRGAARVIRERPRGVKDFAEAWAEAWQ